VEAVEGDMLGMLEAETSHLASPAGDDISVDLDWAAQQHKV